ncbi:hypothetical protein TUM4438_31280 [Shewanella sairae]|uniref:Cadherin-like domain-containing protein n=1 Tax=Shewanella sairae TaxID=190310 RepID=A0ABQ4PLC8_9GAMM|nr:tandem-95 repeat protein [Shewanella sairae]MCL1131898.1 tandem-95 repeat protein [Shewanella sairae]GIU48882.1 hypothetical protein TUM4438_31280 [Shewanella sairae]
MKHNKFIYSVLAASLAMALTACGGDDTGFLDKPTPPEPPTPPVVDDSLQALPQAMLLTVGDKQTIDIKPLVTANVDWSLTNIHDTNGLGAIDNQTTHGFNYTAQLSGMTSLPYEVQGGGLTSNSQILVAINEKPLPPNPDPEIPDDSNTAPTASNITENTTSNKDIAINMEKHIFDADGDALTIMQLVNASGRFSLDADGYTLLFKPNGFIGVDQAMYSVEDGQGGYAIGYVIVNSTDANPTTPNTPPIAKDYSKNIDSLTTPKWDIDLIQLGLISDADNDALEIDRIFDSNGRAVVLGKNTIRYTPASFTGVDQFTYVIKDGKGGYATGTITVTVSHSTTDNAIPTAEPIVIKGVMDNETTPTVIDITDNVSDADNDKLKLVSVMGANGKVSINDNNQLHIDYLPKPEVTKIKDTFTYVVTDGKGGYAMSTGTVLFTPHNSAPPVTEAGTDSTPNDEPLTISLNKYISDADTSNDDLVISNVAIENKDSPATVSLKAGNQLLFKPNGFVGSTTITYTVSDGKHSTKGSFIVVTNPDAEHTLTAADFEVTKPINAPAFTIPWQTLVQSDQDVNFTLINATGSSLGNVTVDSNILSYTPINGKFGVDKFVYTIEDDHSPRHTASGTITVDITPPALPEITELGIVGKPIKGQNLTAKVTCSECVDYEYNWVINGVTVATSQAYTYQSADAGHDVKLTVNGTDQYDQTVTEYVVYEPSTINTVFSNDFAFAALKNDGSVATWGDSSNGGATATDLSDVKTIYSTTAAFAALKNDGSVTTWGEYRYGGDSSHLDGQLVDVKTITSNQMSFAALKNNGSVLAWGVVGNYPSFESVEHLLQNSVKAVYSNKFAYAALKNDGSVVTWGGDAYGSNESAGGDSSSVSSRLNNVVSIFGTEAAFAALKKDGTVVTWGDNEFGSNSASVTSKLKNVRTIYSTSSAFAALKDDGTVVTWGNPNKGGNSTAVSSKLTNVVKIFSTEATFAALKADGSVITWGEATSVTAEFADVIDIFSTSSAFAALKDDGTVVTWGAANNGGNSSSVAMQLTDVENVFSTSAAFTALKADGTIVTWGNSNFGGDNSEIKDTLGTVKNIYSNDMAFVAETDSGSLVAWGNENNGGDNASIPHNELEPTLSEIESSLTH